MAEIPGCFVGDIQNPLHLIGRNAFFGFNHHVNNGKPFMKREMGVMEDCASGYREPASTGVTIKLTAGINTRNAEGLALGTLHTTGPSKILKDLKTFLMRVVFTHHGYQI
ncbi:MAG: hypothetical protein ABIU05_08005 [Nitrospirales bacterium]